MNNLMHHFICKGRKFVIDPQSLLLYEESRCWTLFFRPNHRKQINSNHSHLLERNLEAERKTLNKRLIQERDYLYLNVSHACNMQCHYCFARGGTYGREKQLMSVDIATAAIDWILRTGTGQHLTVNFFGGEPLLNIPTVKATLNYARNQAAIKGKAFRALISTNGTIDLCELADVLCSVAHRITVSIDGSEKIHDLNRPFPDGSPTNSRITTNIERYIQHAGSSRLAAKVTWRRGQSDLVSMAESLIKLEFKKMYIGRETSFMPTSMQPENRSAFTDFDELVIAYDNLANWYVDRLNEGKNIVVQPLHSMLLSVLHAQVTRMSCTAGVSTWCISPEGDIYPCHRFVEKPENKFGNVMNSGSAQVNPPELAPHGLVSPHCDGCWAKYWCFSNSCVYLISIGRDFRLLDGFCRHMFHFLENICFQVSRLSPKGLKTLRSVVSWPDGIPVRPLNRKTSLKETDSMLSSSSSRESEC